MCDASPPAAAPTRPRPEPATTIGAALSGCTGCRLRARCRGGGELLGDLRGRLMDRLRDRIPRRDRSEVRVRVDVARLVLQLDEVAELRVLADRDDLAVADRDQRRTLGGEDVHTLAVGIG